MTVRLLIFVQEAAFADALATRLDAEPDIEVVAALYLRAPSPLLFAGSHADVVFLDGNLPGDAAFSLCEELRQCGDTPRSVFLSYTSDPRHITRAIAAGAVGWVGKNDSIGRLIEVIRGPARGETWLPPSGTGPDLNLLVRGSNPEQDNGGRLVAALIQREREVLVCLAEGANRRDLPSNSICRYTDAHRLSPPSLLTALRQMGVCLRLPPIYFSKRLGASNS